VLFLRLLKESFRFAVNSLIVNRLRTVLSLLGITIGIFVIVAVFSVISSLKGSIEESISTIGDDLVYVQKWPWIMGGKYPWWKFINRPVPKRKEYKYLLKNLKGADAVAFTGNFNATVKYKSASINNTTVMVGTYNFNKVRDAEVLQGRYFGEGEYRQGNYIAIVGDAIAKQLSPSKTIIVKRIHIGTRRYTVIGVLKPYGSGLFGNSLDNMVLIGLNTASKFMNLDNEQYNPAIVVKPSPKADLEYVKAEIRLLMRKIRQLKPSADDNFAINQSSMISQGVEQIFSMVNMGGLFIGIFSILVGGFGIANIMFVSVKERTKIIGIQKALGAKNAFIMFQFLSESVILSLLGGIIGLLLVYGGFSVANQFISMHLFIGFGNVLKGLLISAVIGLLSGYFPARSAAGLNPVEAINQVF
jgi:putative ABC transport system permease protein